VAFHDQARVPYLYLESEDLPDGYRRFQDEL
jgi:hypothetical protein